MNSPTAAAPGAREALLAAARAELAERGHAAISLRAVARRAGVSHAAPKYFFGDRAGLLTAVAAEGFTALTDSLRKAAQAGAGDRLAALGRAYIEFGLTHAALFDLMFRPAELHPGDPALQQAQQEAIGTLSAAVAGPASPESAPPDVPPLALISWALAHGLVVLARDGALRSAAGSDDPAAAAQLARQLASLFAACASQTPAGLSTVT
jgi:AcrR family transcriptional regulator